MPVLEYHPLQMSPNEQVAKPLPPETERAAEPHRKHEQLAAMKTERERDKPAETELNESRSPYRAASMNSSLSRHLFYTVHSTRH